jgi:predicted nucleic acid-binding Zn ribbon protein
MFDVKGEYTNDPEEAKRTKEKWEKEIQIERDRSRRNTIQLIIIGVVIVVIGYLMAQSNPGDPSAPNNVNCIGDRDCG